ncbi:MAG TPA: DUF4435 domain-containing protein [Nostocaceae cyanobacterium]|nr:DUF4435 domain-containing protein [Nostocaceae cyanobacterium]
MDFLNLITEESEEAGAYQEFLLYHKPKNRTFHIFLEGNDDFSFYKNFIHNIIIENIPDSKKYTDYFHLCGSKEKVYELYQKVSPRLRNNKSRGLFFVDKDFSDFLGNNYPSDTNIYVTDCYSVENFLVTEDILRRILQEIYHLNNLDLENVLHKHRLNSDSIINLFLEELKKVQLLLIPIIAWIICIKRNGGKPNLNNIRFESIFQIDDFHLTLCKIKNGKYSTRLKYLESVFNVSTPPNLWVQILNEARKLRKIFNNDNPKIYVRGKYELWFFIQFLNKLEKRIRDVINLYIPPDGKKKPSFKVTTKINKENAIEILGPRVICPTSLKDFLLYHKDNLINS